MMLLIILWSTTGFVFPVLKYNVLGIRRSMLDIICEVDRSRRLPLDVSFLKQVDDEEFESKHW